MSYIHWFRHQTHPESYIDDASLKIAENRVMRCIMYSQLPPTLVEISDLINVKSKFVGNAIKNLRKEGLIKEINTKKPVRYMVLNPTNLSFEF